MTSYFDHFILVKVLSNYMTDSFCIFLSVITMYLVINSYNYVIPNRLQGLFEVIVDHWYDVVKDNLGDKSDYYLLPLITLFLFLLGLNLLGFFLYTFPSTTHISITFGFAIIVWITVMILGYKNFKGNFFSIFMPSGAPIGISPLLVIIEIASNISRPIALGMRLAANLTAGHILLAILSDFSCKLLLFSWSILNLFPIFIIVFMTVLEIGVLAIQAYVFTLLTMIYLRDSIILH